MQAVCADFGAQLCEFNGGTNYVHLLGSFPPTIAFSRLVNYSKECRPGGCGRSSLTCDDQLAGQAAVVRVLFASSVAGPRSLCCTSTSSNRTALLTGSRPAAYATGLRVGARAATLVADGRKAQPRPDRHQPWPRASAHRSANPRGPSAGHHGAWSRGLGWPRTATSGDRTGVPASSGRFCEIHASMRCHQS
jgi:hypothetical protein